MRGLVNTPIKLTILREGADKPIDITVVRDIIKVKAVKYRVENDVGYMKITSFTEKTYRRSRGRDRQDQEAGAGRQAEGLRARPAPQSGRPARPGGQRLRRLPRPRRDRLDARPRSEGRVPLRRRARRRHRRQAADRAGQWRLGLARRKSLPARCRTIAARTVLGTHVLRQGLGPDHHPARRERRAAADDGALLHAVRQVDPGQGHHARHQGRAAAAGRTAGPAT